MKGNIGYKTLSLLFGDISVMISSMGSMVEIMGALAEESHEPAVAEVLQGMEAELDKGASLSEAMTAAGCFPQYAIRMIAAGESSGRLENVTESLAGYYERRDNTRKLIASALTQPLTLLFFLAVIMGAFVCAVLPVLSGVYRSLGGGAEVYVTVSYGVGAVAFALILLVLLAMLYIWLCFRNESKSGMLSRLWVNSRLTKKNAELFNEAFFMSDFATRVAGGVMEDEAFSAAAETVKSDVLQEKLSRAQKRISIGESIDSVLHEEHVLTPVYLHMIRSASRSGQNEEAYARVTAQLFDAAETNTEVLIRQIEPMITGFFTLAVGISLLSVMLPLISIISTIG